MRERQRFPDKLKTAKQKQRHPNISLKKFCSIFKKKKEIIFKQHKEAQEKFKSCLHVITSVQY